MALSLYVFHLFYKFKVLVLVTLCLMVLWATFSYFVDSRQEVSKAKSVVKDFRKVTSLEDTSCVSPTGGASKLTFKASLTLEEVQKENPQVAKGRYHPTECSALQHVAILIPHRNREKHLLYLLEHLHPFLQRQQLDYGIYVIHQAGSTKFNRAKLLNVGYLEALKEANWDCFIFHDVDLVPENDFNIYMCDRQPKHLVVGRNNTGYRLRYRGYFGGVTALTRDQFSRVNGFSNNYWGWGGEDDDLRIRVEMQKMRVVRPSADVARYTMIFHKRDHGNEENGERMKLLRQVSRTWKTDGLNSCSYKLLSVEHNPLYVNITVDFSMQPKIS
uniref:Beta-1,4-galactosyltransferase n=1 Tax=Strix occidentalis caurina TaxID=311401 RepID=A0A8D0FZB6_STROC